MVLKRNFNDDNGDDESEFPAHESKRHQNYGGIFRDVIKETSVQQLVQNIEPLIRRAVREEIERVFSTFSSSFGFSNDQIGSSGSRTIELHFDGIISRILFTSTKVECEDKNPIKIIIRESESKKIISTGPLSSIKITLYVINGDFNPDDREDWTEQEFDHKIVKEREGHRPLLTGKLIIQLKDGVGYFDDICITDNSSWMRCRKFRLGAKVINPHGGVRVREGVSKDFQVKDHRGESYKKHFPPSKDDDVWRLVKIAKDGKSHQRLAQLRIFTVQDFLKLYITNPNHLRNILDKGMSEKQWKFITNHAKTCVLDENEFYMYGPSQGITVVFDSIFKVVGAIFVGQDFQILEKLNIFQKQMVETLKQCAYKNTQTLVRFDSQLVNGLSGGQMLLPSVSNVNFLAEENLMPENSLISDSPENSQFEVSMGESSRFEVSMGESSRFEVSMGESSRFEVSIGESSRAMQSFDSMFRNSFSLTDEYYGLTPESWDPSSFMRPLMSSDHLGSNENFQVENFQGNGVFPVPRNKKPRARWCKLRAAIKWRILVRKKWLSREREDFQM